MMHFGVITLVSAAAAGDRPLCHIFAADDRARVMARLRRELEELDKDKTLMFL